ncbi:MAG: four helix bundle protein [Cytophagaceae bacterium]|jgi:four helix bundle protein|nr:four helix bundle protein [Cytophagaceae bacterium]
MSIQKFEDLIAWEKAQDLSVNIYSTFRNIKDLDFKSQLCRASVSISNNIAEGFDRGSKAEFKRFLFISKASGNEVKSMLYLAFRLNYLTEVDFDQLLNQTSEVIKIINGLLKSISQPPLTTKN